MMLPTFVAFRPDRRPRISVNMAGLRTQDARCLFEARVIGMRGGEGLVGPRRVLEGARGSRLQRLARGRPLPGLRGDERRRCLRRIGLRDTGSARNSVGRWDRPRRRACGVRGGGRAGARTRFAGWSRSMKSVASTASGISARVTFFTGDADFHIAFIESPRAGSETPSFSGGSSRGGLAIASTEAICVAAAATGGAGRCCISIVEPKSLRAAARAPPGPAARWAA